MPRGYSLKDGDCDDNNERIHSGAPEVCTRPKPFHLRLTCAPQ
jgi:Putative metal-binding motif